MKKKFLLIAILIPISSYACSCVIPAKESEKEKAHRLYTHADYIFVGNLTNVEYLNTSNTISSGDPVKYTFEIIETFKGTIQSKTIEIYSASSGISCGYEFKMGLTYLVHYSKSQYLPRQFPLLISDKIINSTGICVGNKLRRQMSKKNLKLYRRWYKRAKA